MSNVAQAVSILSPKTVVFSGTGTQAKATFAANQYRAIEYHLDWSGAVSVQNMKLTGISAGTYQEIGSFGSYGSTTGTFVSAGNASQWFTGGGTIGPGDANGTVWLPPAPLKKRHVSGESDTATGRLFAGHSNDVTHDPTELTFDFSGSTAWTLTIVNIS